MKIPSGITYLFSLLLWFSLTGCSTIEEQIDAFRPTKAEPSASTPLILATPLQTSYESELALARIGQMLSEMELTPEQRAELLYERAVVFDQVGLRSLARLDFNRALREKPRFAEAYNFIGVYLVQQQHFDEAYEAFDSALEIEPNYDFAYLNRGIALYYGKRPDLARSDMQRFYALDPYDPYRLLWLYLVEVQIDPVKALADLEERYDEFHTDSWNWELVRFYLGKSSAARLMDRVIEDVENNRELAERLCETYFYMAKYELQHGRRNEAISYFKLALSNNVYDFIEHRYALLELELMSIKHEDPENDFSEQSDQ